MKINAKFQSTVDAYNKFAPQFIQHLEQKTSDIEMNVFAELLPKGGQILEAGCGSCRDAALLMKRGYSVLGIDASKGLLKEAKKIHPEVKTQAMSLTELDFEENHFDGIWCRATLLHIDRSEVPKVLSDFYRILKPGGVLFLSTKKGKGEGTQPIPFDQSKTRFFTFFEKEELKQLLSQAGFSVLESHDYDSKDRTKTKKSQEWVVVFAKKHKNTVKQKSSKVVYKNKWMVVKEDQVEFQNGAKGIFGVVEKPDFVIIIPYQDGKLHLVRQYRYPVRGSYWEFPQGSYEDDQSIDIVELVRKELKEETGLTCGALQQLGHLFEAYGYSNQGFYVFFATDLVQGKKDLEISEQDMESKTVTLKEFENMVRTGEIKDAPTIAAYGLIKMSSVLSDKR